MTQRLLSCYKRIDLSASLQIDSLRGASAIAVLAAHSFQIFIAPLNHALYGAIGLIAQSAVMLFFVLSGFLITKSVTRTYSAGFSAFRYASDRANRIIPPLLVSICICTLLWAISPYFFPSGTRDISITSEFVARSEFGVTIESIVGTLLFLNGFISKNIGANAPLWSLPFEAWYYVAAGVIASCRGTKGIALAVAILVTLGLVNKFFLLYSVVWFSGAAVCIAHNKSLHNTFIAKVIAIASLIIASSIGVYYLIEFYSISQPSQINMKIIAAYNTFIGIFFAACLFLTVTGSINVGEFFAKSASFSYTLYVIHFPIALFMYGSMQSHVGEIIPAIYASIACFVICIFASRLIAQYAENIRIFPASQRLLSK